MKYDPQFNDLRASLPSSRKRGGISVTEAEAATVANSTFAKLCGVIRCSDFSSVPRKSSTVTVRGIDESVLGENVDEYHFTYERRINGTLFPNAGVRITIGSDGQPRLIRLGGAITMSHHQDGVEVPDDAVPEEVSLDLTEAQAFAQFSAEHPDAKVFSQTVAYTFNRAADRIEPRLLVAYSITGTDGENVSMSRRRHTAYPLRSNGEVVDFTPPSNPETTGATKPSP